VRTMAPRIHQVSSERIREELTRILTEGQAARGFRMLEESGLHAQVIPELQWTEHIEESLALVKPGAPADFAMGVLLHHTPVSEVQRIVERLKFSRAEMHHVLALVESLPRFSQVRQMSISALKRFFRLDRFEDHLELARIHADEAAADLADYRYARQKRNEWTDEEVWPQLLVTGDDLVALGFAPGPLFKEILTTVEDEQLEGRLLTCDAALEFVKRRWAS
jgi:poly(A) polymerase